jgi:hypothetical protein
MLVDPGVVVRINCPVEASPQLHFDGDGTYEFRADDYRVLHADWFPSLQKAIDAVPGVPPGPGGGGEAVIQMSAKIYYENVVIGGPNETKDIRLKGPTKYHSSINGRDLGPALRVENSRVHLSDFTASSAKGSGHNAIEMIDSAGGLGGAMIERIGIGSAGLDGLFISGGVRFWVRDLNIRNISRNAITLGTEEQQVSEIFLEGISARNIADGNYGLNIVNAQMVRATGRVWPTTTPVNIEGAASRIYLDIYGVSREWEGYRQ